MRKDSCFSVGCGNKECRNWKESATIDYFTSWTIAYFTQEPHS